MIQNPYVRLMRLDKPIGIFLLWYPTAWALWIANQGIPHLKLLVLFFAGTIIMRSTGCVINDLADRKFDKEVARTKKRPLASGELQPNQVLSLLGTLMLSAFIIALNLPIICLYYAVIAVLLTIIYPFCKRFIQTPQFVLSLAFTMGIPMAYAASEVPLNFSTLLLLIINMLWIIVYDTQYAMVDKPDDLKIGVKSTAIYFGDRALTIIQILQLILHSAWLILAWMMDLSVFFYISWFLAGSVLYFQNNLFKNQEYFKAFLSNNYYGFFMWIGIIL